MSQIIYNVDKSNIFKQLVTVEVTSLFYPVYFQVYEEDVGLAYTSPEFLGRLRRVKHDGSLIGRNTIDVLNIPRGGKIYIAPDNQLFFSLKTSKDPSKETIVFKFKLKNGICEGYYPVEIPKEFYGNFNSSISITEQDLNLFLDSYKVPVMPRSIRGVNNVAIMLDDASYADYVDEIDFEEINF